ncbi:Holliday junction resolvase RecU [Oceanobacillus sp. FSL H7-0719]
MLLKNMAAAKTAKNKYDFLFYHNKHLFPIELKSTKSKSISFSESMIKEYQIKSLTEASKFKGVMPGFIFNFRTSNETFFIPIHKFNEYKNIAENQLEHTYKSKVNKASIPIAICEEIGVKIEQKLNRTRYFYRIDKLFEELIHKYE